MSKWKSVLGLGLFVLAPSLMAQRPQEVSLDKGLGFLGFLIVGLLGLISLSFAGYGGMHMHQDPGKAKLAFAGAIAVPIVAGIVYYVFKTVFKIDLTFSSTL